MAVIGFLFKIVLVEQPFWLLYFYIWGGHNDVEMIWEYGM